MSCFQEKDQESPPSCSNNLNILPADYQTYPPINDNILFNITNNLQKYPGFYIKVLELMKQLNLSVSSEAIDNSVKPDQLPAQNDSDSEESEIETDVHFRNYTFPPKEKILQAQANRELRKKTLFHKYRQWVSSTPCAKPKEIVFEPPKFIIKKKKIQILCSKAATNLNQLGNALLEKPLLLLTNEEIMSNRIKMEQILEYPIFQNYEPGIQSNKLYVKNLAGTTSISDLKTIFYRYILENEEEIDIRLFKIGKLKDQCFVTFKLFENRLRRREGEHLIEKARLETHGLILKSKPMFVVYGKYQRC